MGIKLTLPLTVGATRRYTNVLSGLAFFFFFVPGILMLFDLAAKRPVGENPQTHVYLGIAFCITGVLLAVAISVLLTKVPRTMITEAGILSPAYSTQIVPWSGIKSVQTGLAAYIPYIRLYLKDECSSLPAPSKLSQTLRAGYISIVPLGSGLAFSDMKRLCNEMVSRSRM